MAKVSIFVGSVYGNASHVANEAKTKAENLGFTVELFEDPRIENFTEAETVVFITSTTGQGDLPPNIEFFVEDIRNAFPLMAQKPFAVAALGDSSYGDSYCGAGETVFSLLEELQGKSLAPLLRIDAIETLEPEKDIIAWIETILKTV
jgi:flavodoxin